jgi:thiamine kinase-like enzyme/choline kinase
MTDLAVILAARKERTSDVPYPLLPFEGNQCLIDRTLRLLKEVGVNRVLMVVGFREDLFSKYTGESVQLVRADNYEFSSSMSSLAAAQDFIDEDFLLVEGDTFFEKKVLEHLVNVKEGNCLVATEESGSGDECYIESQSGFITKISKDKHRICKYEGELLGVSRISIDTYYKMLDLWKRSTNSYLNYEHVLMDVTTPLDRPFAFFKNLIWGDVDCPEDFKRLKEVTSRILRRKEDPFDKENLLHYLIDIFPGKDISQIEIIQIGGMSNKNFLVNFEGNSYVLRVPGPGSEGMVERSNEEFNAIEACKMGVNPQIRYFNAKTGIKLADYIENAETLNTATIKRHDNLKKIAGIYHKVHNAHVRLKNEFNIFQEIEKYDVLLEKCQGQMYEGWEDFKPKVMALEDKLNTMGVEMCPCHDDAVPENFIKAEDGAIYLIDWEYSGMNDPMADFAALFLESDFSEEERYYFLRNYYGDEIPSNIHEHILCYEILWDTLWAQWTVIKEAAGDVFGSYGLDRYNRARDNYNKLTINNTL